MLVLVGASASGKTEVTKKLIEHYGFKKLVTYTTRKKRPQEINGIDYYFLDKIDFLKRKDQNFFLETTVYNKNYYGTSFKDVDNKKVLIVEPIGANKIYEMLGNKVSIFLLKAREETRTKRMLKRGDTRQSIVERIANDKECFDEKNFKHLDDVIVTDDLSLDELAKMIYEKYNSIVEKQWELLLF